MARGTGSTAKKGGTIIAFNLDRPSVALLDQKAARCRTAAASRSVEMRNAWQNFIRASETGNGALHRRPTSGEGSCSNRNTKCGQEVAPRPFGSGHPLNLYQFLGRIFRGLLRGCDTFTEMKSISQIPLNHYKRCTPAYTTGPWPAAGYSPHEARGLGALCRPLGGAESGGTDEVRSMPSARSRPLSEGTMPT